MSQICKCVFFFIPNVFHKRYNNTKRLLVQINTVGKTGNDLKATTKAKRLSNYQAKQPQKGKTKNKGKELKGSSNATRMHTRNNS